MVLVWSECRSWESRILTPTVLSRGNYSHIKLCTQKYEFSAMLCGRLQQQRQTFFFHLLFDLFFMLYWFIATRTRGITYSHNQLNVSCQKEREKKREKNKGRKLHKFQCFQSITCFQCFFVCSKRFTYNLKPFINVQNLVYIEPTSYVYGLFLTKLNKCIYVVQNSQEYEIVSLNLPKHA